MTTGRINQVTILGPHGGGNPPKGVESSITIKGGHAEAHPAARANPRERADDRRPIQLPPLSFPGSGPSRERSGATRQTPRLARPARRRPAACHALSQAVTNRGLPPRVWVGTMAKPVIHRHRVAPAASTQQDFGSPPQA
jgi:hypothetical protein